MNAFVVLLAGLLPTYLMRFPILGIPTNLFEAFVWLLFISSLCFTRTRRQIVTAVRALPVNTVIWMCLFLAAAVISAMHSPVLRSSLGILKGWIVTPMMFGMLVYTARYTDPTVSKKVVRSLILSGLVIALLGISQLNGLTRIQSIYDVPNSLALFLVPIFVIALWVGVHTKNKLYMLFSLVMLVAIIGTQSFGAIVALLGTFLVAVPSMWKSSSRVRLVVPGLLFFLVMVPALFFVSGRVQYLIRPFIQLNTTNSATVRLQLWDIGIRLLQKNPILGVGLGQFEGAYQSELHGLFEQVSTSVQATKYTLQPEFVFRDPHNWVISFWLNMGLLGLVSFVALNAIAIQKWKHVHGSNNVYTQAVILGVISILIFGLFDTIYWKNDLSALWWMLLALVF